MPHFFPSRKSRKNFTAVADELFDMLKNNPDTAFVCDKFIAVYNKERDKVIFMPGDFSGMSEMDALLVVERRLNNLNASMN